MAYDDTEILAVGAGPSNLSLAALAAPITGVRLTAVEARDSVSWHPGLMWTTSRLQVSAVKDLVSLVDPRSRFSFVNFLHEHGRLYRHLIAGAEYVSRREFGQYFGWVAEKVGVRLGETVHELSHDGSVFVARTSRGVRRSRSVVLGVGQAPYVPDCARNIDSPRVWHAAEHLTRGLPSTGRTVLLVGGGQSAGEIALDLLSQAAGPPRRLIWVTGGAGLRPLDDSAFSNEWFNPRFAEYFQRLGAEHRMALLGRQSDATCGITGELLTRTYRKLYELDYLGDAPFAHTLLAGSRLTGLREGRQGFHAAVQDTVTGERQEYEADLVVLATGFRPVIPDFLAPLRDRLPVRGDGYEVDRDYRLLWDGPDENRIYVQNAAQHSHGVADPNLGLAAWRSAVILNSLLDREHYSLKAEDITLSLR